jgi:threonine/homoserine/homoserine lactone efflux protein
LRASYPRRQAVAPHPGGARPEGHDLATSFRRGLRINLTNPKDALFFGTVLTGMLPSPAPAWLQMTGVGAQSAYGRANPPLNRVIGTMLAAFGIAIVIE